MGITEQGGKVAISMVEGMRSQPLALALITINVVFLVGGGWVLHDLASRTTEASVRRDKMLTEFVTSCHIRTLEEMQKLQLQMQKQP